MEPNEKQGTQNEQKSLYRKLSITNISQGHIPIRNLPKGIAIGSQFTDEAPIRITTQQNSTQVLEKVAPSQIPVPRPISTSNFTPISSINPYNRNWRIIGRCTSKGCLRTYNNARGSGI